MRRKIKNRNTFRIFYFSYFADGQVVHPKKVIGTPIGWLLTIVKSAFASLKRHAERLFIGKNLIFAGGVMNHTPVLKEDFMDIAVVGSGGVGGFIACMLAQKYDITLVARGEKGDKYQKEGIKFISDIYGTKIVKPKNIVKDISKLTTQDIIFICVKNYSLEEVCLQLKNSVRENTVIVPVMNGIEPGNTVRRLLGSERVVDSLIYLIGFLTEDYDVRQLDDVADIYLGSYKENKEDAKIVCDILKSCGIRCEYSDNIEKEIWKKYILNCAYNVETAYYDNTIGQLRDDENKTKEYLTLIDEAYSVAKAKNINIREDDISYIKNKFFEYDYNATSSLQRDIRAGKKCESDIFGKYLVEQADNVGVDVPVSRKMYEKLKNY